MASKFQLVATLCFLSALLGVATAATPTFTIEGRVYCDTCRAGFETSATEYISDAKVKIECKNYTTDEVTQNVPGKADSTGTYNIVIEDNHDEEICEVVLVESPRSDCNEIKSDRSRARILLTQDSGISTNVRYANSLGFLKSEPLPLCGELLKMYALSDDQF